MVKTFHENRMLVKVKVDEHFQYIDFYFNVGAIVIEWHYTYKGFIDILFEYGIENVSDDGHIIWTREIENEKGETQESYEFNEVEEYIDNYLSIETLQYLLKIELKLIVEKL